MAKKCFVPIEAWAFASPSVRLNGRHTDVGLMAEALVFFDEVIVNIQSSQHLADVLNSFKCCYGNITPLLDLISSGVLKIHYFDFRSSPINNQGVFSYWNIQDKVSEDSHLQSFQQKILYGRPIENVLLKARHRTKMYNLFSEKIIIDGSDKYGNAIEAARESARSHDDIQLLLEAFVKELPNNYQNLFPSKIDVKAFQLEANKTEHRYNFDFNLLKKQLPHLNFWKHTPGTGLIHAHRIIYSSRLHNYDIYLPNPLSSLVLAKMSSLSLGNRKFKETAINLQCEANFPDLRTEFNTGETNWKEILYYREKAQRFRDWFSIYGGNPEIAIESYGEEFQACTGTSDYKTKLFSISSFLGTIAGVAVERLVTGNNSAIGPVLGTAVGGMTPFVKDLFTASDADGWQPRFFGNWLHKEINS